MIYINSNSTSPYFNFALEEYLLTKKDLPEDKIFLFWRTSPTVMVGRYQNTYNEINEKYIKENNVKNKALRLTVFDEGYNISLRDITYNEDTYKKGFSLCISPIKRGDSIIYRHKTTNYFESMYSKHYATDRNFDDAIFLDSLSNILECSMSNIFFIKSNTIYTPKSSSPILNGIMKSNVKSICKNLDINLVECDINISCIDEYDAVFVTNSLMGIMPVTNICDINYDKNYDLIKKLQKNL